MSDITRKKLAEMEKEMEGQHTEYLALLHQTKGALMTIKHLFGHLDQEEQPNEPDDGLDVERVGGKQKGKT
jgi:hypothetical protein